MGIFSSHWSLYRDFHAKIGPNYNEATRLKVAAKLSPGQVLVAYLSPSDRIWLQ